MNNRDYEPRVGDLLHYHDYNMTVVIIDIDTSSRASYIMYHLIDRPYFASCSTSEFQDEMRRGAAKLASRLE